MFRVVLMLLASLASFLCVNAQTSLYIPGFDPQPISANVLGVGSDGRTTWQLEQGQATGTFTDDSGFIGTATLIEGPNDAVLTYSNSVEFQLGISCSISIGIAVCGGVVDGSTDIETETVSPFVVQGGGTISPSTPATTPAPTPSPSNSLSSGNSSGTRGGSPSPSVPSVTSGGAPTQTTNSGLRTTWSFPITLGVFGITVALM